MKQTKADKLADKRIDAACKATCSGITIPIMEIMKVFKVGRAAVAKGVDDATLAQQIRAYVETIKV
jgi:hypothetical protein